MKVVGRSPLRIGIDITHLQPPYRYRGIGSYVRGLLSGLFAIDSVNQYFLFVFGEFSSTDLGNVLDNFHIVKLPFPRIGRASALLTHQVVLPYVLSLYNLDVFHSPGIVSVPSVPSMPLWQTVKTIVTVHDLTPLVYQDVFLKKLTWRLFYQITLMSVKRCAHIICDSENTKQDLIRLLQIEAERISVIPLAPDPLFSHEALAADNADNSEAFLPIDNPFILHVGGGHYNKNTDTLIQAYAKLCHEHRIKENLVLVGEGYNPAKILHSDPEVLSRVVVLQKLPWHTLAVLYRCATVFVYPSLYEGFGLPPLEAMASGTPVIASNTSSLPEVVGNAAILIDPHNEAELANAILRCLRDPALRADMQQRGAKWIQSFSWNRTAQETVAVYTLVAERGK